MRIKNISTLLNPLLLYAVASKTGWAKILPALMLYVSSDTTDKKSFNAMLKIKNIEKILAGAPVPWTLIFINFQLCIERFVKIQLVPLAVLALLALMLASLITVQIANTDISANR